MKLKLKLPILFLSLLFIISFLSVFQENGFDTTSNSTLNLFITDAPISINGNGGFAIYASTGDGSAGDPYIIENYNINASGTLLDGINIVNTFSYFILRNCTVVNGDTNKAGIRLFNVRNGVITNNTVKFNTYGIFYQSSSDNLLSDNKMINNSYTGLNMYVNNQNTTVQDNIAINNTNYGFFVGLSDNTTLYRNYAIDNQHSGYYFSESVNCTIDNNFAWTNKWYGAYIRYFNHSLFEGNDFEDGNSYGISLYRSNNNTLISNDFSRNSIYGILMNEAYNNSIIENTVDYNPMGIRLSQNSGFNEIANNSFSNCVSNGIYLITNSSNNLIENNTLNNNDRGIYLIAASANNTITKNTLNNNTYGIFLDDYPLDNVVTYNRIYNSTIHGIYLLDGAEQNKIARNYVYFSEDTGIYLENADNNEIKGNILGANNVNLNQTNCVGNIFFNNTILRYIQILSDTDFAKYTTKGTGLPNDPYVIENWEINSETLGIHGISIVNTESYFTIQNCQVINSELTGIYLNNVYPHEIINCTIEGNHEYGIQIIDSNNFNITGNTVNNNSYDGINLDGCNYNRLINNTANDNGDEGISLLYTSDNNILYENFANNNLDYGIQLYAADSNIVSNNTANGNVIGFYFGFSSHNNTVFDNTANNNLELGFYLTTPYNSSYFQNTANNNMYSGFWVGNGATNNNISWNTLHYNREGIFEHPESTGNIIENNDIINRPSDAAISINQNSDFEIYKSQGDGSVGNPYVIEGKILDTRYLDMPGILINNTNAFFVIQNCTFLDGDYSWAGLELLNVTNGLIQNNTAYTRTGIYLENTNNTIIINNSLIRNDIKGVHLLNTRNINITNNMFRELGTPSGNDDVLLVDLSTDIRIADNRLIKCNHYGILLSYTNFSSVINNTVYYNTRYGIYLFWSNNNTVIHNEVNQNSWHSIYMRNSNYNQFLNNTIIDAKYHGFNPTLNSTFNQFSYNIVDNASATAFYLTDDASYNTITWNVLVRNADDYWADGTCIGTIYQNNVITDTFPQWSDLGINPTDIIEYAPNLPFQCTITWDDTITWTDYFGITSVLFEFNGVNYTPTYLGGDDYSFGLIDLPAGNHCYQWFACDTANQWNTTGINWINISRADPQLRLFLNGTEGSYGAPYGSIINITTAFDTQAPLLTLVYNSSNFLTGATTSFWNFTSCGISQISAICTGNENYTGDVVLYFLNIDDDRLPQIGNIKTNPASGVMYSPGASYQFNATCIDFESGIETVILELNGVNFTVQNHLGNEYYYTFTDLAAGNRPYRWFAKDRYDNWAVSSIDWFNIIRRDSNIFLWLNGSQSDFTAPTGSLVRITTFLNDSREVNVFNESNLLTTTTDSYWTFSSIGVFTIQAVAFPNANYTGVSVSYDLNVTDGYGPTIFNTETSPSSPAIYEPGVTYVFRTDIIDETAIDLVILEVNSQNITVTTHAGSLYFHFIEDLPAGSYFYRWYARDMFNNWARSNQYLFTLNPKTADVQLYLNGTQGNFTAPTWSLINITVVVEDSRPIYIRNESVTISTAYSSIHNFTSIGLFQIRAFSNGNANYTVAIQDYYLNMTDGYRPQVSNILTNPISPIIYQPREYYQFNATWIDESPIEAVLLEINGVNFSVTQSVGNEYYQSFYDVPAADRQYRWFAQDIYGNWGVSASYWFNITPKTPTLHLYLNETESDLVTNAGTIINITYSIENNQNVLILNESSFLTNDITSFWDFPWVGDFQIQALYGGDINYTPTLVSLFLNLTDGSLPSITNLEISPSNFVEYYPGAQYQLNATCYDESGIETVLLELNNLNHTVSTRVGDEFYYKFLDLPAGDYFFRWFAKDYFNKWQMKGSWLNITRTSPTIQLYLNGTQNNISMAAKSWINITVALDFAVPIAVFNESNLLTSTFMSWWKFKAVGYFKILAISMGSENYTPAMISYYINVTDSYRPLISQFITSPSSPAEYVSGADYQFNITFLDHSGIDTVILEFNGVNYTVTNHSDFEYFITFNNLSIGTYQLRWFANDSYGNWLVTSFYEFSVTEAGAPMDWIIYLIIALIGAIVAAALVIGVRRRTATSPTARPFKPPKSKPQVNECGVHKGTIKGLNYVCMNCGVAYCLNCAEQLSKQKRKGNCLYCNTPMNYYNIQYQVIEQAAKEEPAKGMADKEKEIRKPPAKNYYHLKKEAMAQTKDDETVGLKKKVEISKKKVEKEPEENFYKKKSEEFALKKDQKEVTN